MTAMTAYRVCWPEPGRAVVETFEIGSPGPGHVLVETQRTVISPGTERAFFLRLPNAEGRFPSYPGYSNLGRVIEVGPGLEAFQVGDRVVSHSPHASHVMVAAERCFRVPKPVPDSDAVYASLAAIALQGVRKARIELGEAVLVLGLGLVGNLAIQLAKLQGALPAVGADPDAERRRVALECGADACLDPEELLPSADSSLNTEHSTLNPQPSAVLEATGVPEAVNQALALAGPHARVVLLASTRGVTETNFYRDVHKKGLTVLGAHASARPPADSSPGYWTHGEDLGTVLRLMEAGRLRLDPLTSQALPWSEAPRAYEALASWRKDLLGLHLVWKGEP